MANRSRRPKGMYGLPGGKPIQAVLALLLIAAVIFVFNEDFFGIGGFSGEAQQSDVPKGEIEESTSNLEVRYLDVGQGTSILVRIPTDSGVYHNMLIDSGERDYADGLVQYIKGMGISRIDTLMVSHPHSDHMGGMAKVIANFEIGEMYMPEIAEADTPTSSSYENMLEAIEKYKVSLNRLYSDCIVKLPGTVKCSVYSPIQGTAYGDLNNYSAVLRLEFGGTSFMFTGDAEKRAEGEILSNGYSIKSDVLCLGHHGSSTSTSRAFFEEVDPEAVIISCGRDNSYGHPHKEIIKMLSNYNTGVYRTDLQNTIVIISDGENIEIHPDMPSVKN